MVILMTLQHAIYDREYFGSVSNRKQDVLRNLKRVNPDCYELYELVEMQRKGQLIGGKLSSDMLNPYIQALLIIRYSKYPIKASDVARMCDITKYRVRHLTYYDLVEVVRQDNKKRNRYVISELGDQFLKNCLSTPSSTPDMNTWDEIQMTAGVIP